MYTVHSSEKYVTILNCKLSNGQWKCDFLKAFKYFRKAHPKFDTFQSWKILKAL